MSHISKITLHFAPLHEAAWLALHSPALSSISWHTRHEDTRCYLIWHNHKRWVSMSKGSLGISKSAAFSIIFHIFSSSLLHFSLHHFSQRHLGYINPGEDGPKRAQPSGGLLKGRFAAFFLKRGAILVGGNDRKTEVSTQMTQFFRCEVCCPA